MSKCVKLLKLRNLGVYVSASLKCIDRLPEEIWREIFHFISIKDKVACAEINKTTARMRRFEKRMLLDSHNTFFTQWIQKFIKEEVIGPQIRPGRNSVNKVIILQSLLMKNPNFWVFDEVIEEVFRRASITSEVFIKSLMDVCRKYEDHMRFVKDDFLKKLLQSNHVKNGNILLPLEGSMASIKNLRVSGIVRQFFWEQLFRLDTKNCIIILDGRKFIGAGIDEVEARIIANAARRIKKCKTLCLFNYHIDEKVKKLFPNHLGITCINYGPLKVQEEKREEKKQ